MAEPDDFALYIKGLEQKIGAISTPARNPIFGFLSPMQSESQDVPWPPELASNKPTKIQAWGPAGPYRVSSEEPFGFRLEGPRNQPIIWIATFD